MQIYNRYKRLQKYYLGVPVDPPEFQKGDLVTTAEFIDIERCENLYNWIVVENEYFCIRENDNTYTRYQKLQAHDKITNEPIDPPIYIYGDKITDGCTEEECNGKPRYQDLFDRTEVIGGWQIDVYLTQVSYDCGNTWEDFEEYNKINEPKSPEDSFENNYFVFNDAVTSSCANDINIERSYWIIGDDNELYFLDLYSGKTFYKLDFETKSIKKIGEISEEWFRSHDMYCNEAYRYTYTLHSEAQYIFNCSQPHYNHTTGELTYLYRTDSDKGDSFGISSYNILNGETSEQILKSYSEDISNANAYYYYNGHFYASVYLSKSNKAYYYKISEETHEVTEFKPSKDAIWYNTTGSYTWYLDYNKNVIYVINGGTKYTYSMEDYQEISRTAEPINISYTKVENEIPSWQFSNSPQMIYDNICSPIYTGVNPNKSVAHAIYLYGDMYYLPESITWEIEGSTMVEIAHFTGVKGDIAAYRSQDCIYFIDLYEYLINGKVDTIWKDIEGYNCVNGDKYQKVEKYQYNAETKQYDMVSPKVISNGMLIETDSSDCGVTWEKSGNTICEQTDDEE